MTITRAQEVKVGNVEVHLPSETEIRAALTALASRGGKARAKSPSAKRRREIAAMGGAANAAAKRGK